METFADVYHWLRLAVLGIFIVLSVMLALRMGRTRRFSTGRGATVVVLLAIATAGMWVVTTARPSVLWAALLLLVGIGIGFLAGRAAKPAPGRPDALTHSPLAAIVVAAGMVFAGMTLLFGTAYLFAIALLVLTFAVGCALGQFIGEIGRAAALGAAGTQAGTPSATPQTPPASFADESPPPPPPAAGWHTG